MFRNKYKNFPFELEKFSCGPRVDEISFQKFKRTALTNCETFF